MDDAAAMEVRERPDHRHEEVEILCHNAEVDITPDPYMTVVVFDRMVLDSGDPLYQAMPPGGLSTSRGYFLHCRKPAGFAP